MSTLNSTAPPFTACARAARHIPSHGETGLPRRPDHGSLANRAIIGYHTSGCELVAGQLAAPRLVRDKKGVRHHGVAGVHRSQT